MDNQIEGYTVITKELWETRSTEVMQAIGKYARFNVVSDKTGDDIFKRWMDGEDIDGATVTQLAFDWDKQVWEWALQGGVI